MINDYTFIINIVLLYCKNRYTLLYFMCFLLLNCWFGYVFLHFKSEFLLKFMYKFYYICTVSLCITWGWTVQVHYMQIFFNKYLHCFWFTIRGSQIWGTNCMHWSTPFYKGTEYPWILVPTWSWKQYPTDTKYWGTRIVHTFSTVRGRCPSPCVVQGLTVPCILYFKGL